MIPKILFLHGFFASGNCIPAQILKQALEGKAEVLMPNLPLHPREALAFIKKYYVPLVEKLYTTAL